MPSNISYTAARARFASLCDDVSENRKTVIIHRKGAEDVALFSAAELRSLAETAHLLRSSRNVKRLLAALARARRRRTSPQSVTRLRRQVGLDLSGKQAPLYERYRNRPKK